MFKTIRAFFIFLIFSKFLIPSSHASNMPYYFAVAPEITSTQLLTRLWMPVLEDISELSGIQLTFVAPKGNSTFEYCLSSNAYDIAYMNPYHYLKYGKQSGYRAISKQVGMKVKGLLIAKKESLIENLSDLNNETIAFPSPSTFGSSILIRTNLTRFGISFSSQYVNSHESVFKVIERNIFKVGGVDLLSFNAHRASEQKFRILYETKEYTPHAIGLNRNLTNIDAANLQASLEKLSMTSPELIKKLGISGFENAEEKDWDDVQKLNFIESNSSSTDTKKHLCHSG